MNEFVKILISLSFSGTLLLLIVFLLKQFYKRKFSKCWQYYIWLAVALRFLLPFTPETTVTGRLFAAADIIISESGASHEDYPLRANGTSAGTGNQQPDKIADPVTDTADIEPVPVPVTPVPDHTSRTPAALYPILLLVWSAVTLVLIIRKITIYQSFMQYVKAGTTEVSDLNTLNLLAGCEEKLKIRKAVELYHNPIVASPIMTGFFHPCIILPDIRLTEEDMTHIFIHELIHYKRGDLFYKWFVQFIICIHWFNPFVYLLGEEINRACELACDEAVICSIDEKARISYGNLLISSVKSEHNYENKLASVTLTEGAKQLKERLGEIMNFKKKSRMITGMTAVLTLLILTCFNTLGAYGGADGRSQQAAGQSSENRLLYENGVYYIFGDGASQSDKPSSAFTEGTIGIVFVKKDGYSSFGPFSDQDELAEELPNICKRMGQYLTQEEIELILEKADLIHQFAIPPTAEDKADDNKKTSFIYTQSGYYQNSYIIEMGWNLNAKLNQPYSAQTEITLKDNSKLTVYFTDNAKKYVSDTEAVAAIGELIDSLKDKKTKLAIEKPLILGVTPVAESELPAKAKEFYANGDLVKFSAVFSRLDKELKKELSEQIYNNGQIAFFSTIVEYLDEETINLYAEKAEQDGKVNFFAILLGYLKAEEIGAYAETYYKADKIAGFSIVVSYLTKEEQQSWLNRAKSDNKNTFIAVISSELSD